MFLCVGPAPDETLPLISRCKAFADPPETVAFGDKTDEEFDPPPPAPPEDDNCDPKYDEDDDNGAPLALLNEGVIGLNG